jgi:hypothetical protein
MFCSGVIEQRDDGLVHSTRIFALSTACAQVDGLGHMCVVIASRQDELRHDGGWGGGLNTGGDRYRAPVATEARAECAGVGIGLHRFTFGALAGSS